jgi:hypothetical protein
MPVFITNTASFVVDFFFEFLIKKLLLELQGVE